MYDYFINYLQISTLQDYWILAAIAKNDTPFKRT